LAATVPVLAIVVACGGSSVQFVSVPAEGGDDDGASSADGSAGGDSGGRDVAADGVRPEGGTFGCNYDGGPFPLDSFNSCTANTPCVAVLHEVSCCGNRLAVGVNHNESQDFTNAEQAWEATCPKCGCPVGVNVDAQDGKSGPFQSVRVQCDLSGPGSTGKCVTFF
jgi:hypothetical protein